MVLADLLCMIYMVTLTKQCTQSFCFLIFQESSFFSDFSPLVNFHITLKMSQQITSYIFLIKKDGSSSVLLGVMLSAIACLSNRAQFFSLRF